MRTGWRQCTLGEALTLQRGFDLPERQRRPGTVPVVSSSGVTGWHDTAKVRAPGVVTGRYGTLGDVFYVKEDFWPLNTALYVRDFKGNHPRFIHYLLHYYLGMLKLAQHNAASVLPGVNRNALHRLVVSLPPLPIQRSIAGILTAYDDLIENATRRIANLEERARLLYDEWFVKFRFPGHERVRLVESAVGMVPQGWEVRSLGDICSITMGQSPSSTFYNQGGNGLPFHQGVSDFGSRFPTDRVYCTLEHRVAHAGDILFSVRAPVGRLNLSLKKIVIGRGLCAIRSKNEGQRFIFQQLKQQFQEEDTIGNGSIFRAVTKDEVYNLKLLWPPSDILCAFDAHLQPIFALLESLSRENTALRQTRDRLLPGLVAGEIDVAGRRAGEAPEMASVLARRVAEAAGHVEPVGDEGMGWDSLWE